MCTYEQRLLVEALVQVGGCSVRDDDKCVDERKREDEMWVYAMRGDVGPGS